MKRAARYEPFEVAIAPSPHLMLVIGGLWLAGVIAASVVVAAYLNDRKWWESITLGATSCSALTIAAVQWRRACRRRWVVRVLVDGRCVHRYDEQAIRIEWAIGAWTALHSPVAKLYWLVGPGSIRNVEAARRFNTYARWALGRVDRDDAVNPNACTQP